MGKYWQYFIVHTFLFSINNTAGGVSSLSPLKLTPAIITATAIAESDDKELYWKHRCEMLGRRVSEQWARSLRIHNEPGLRHGRRYRPTRRHPDGRAGHRVKVVRRDAAARGGRLHDEEKAERCAARQTR